MNLFLAVSLDAQTMLFGFPIAVLVAIAIQGLKSFWPSLPTRYVAPLTGLATFVLVILAAYIVHDAPPLTAEIIGAALTAGLAPMGIYAVAKSITNPASPLAVAARAFAANAQTISLPAGQAVTIVNAVSAAPVPTPTPIPTPTPTPAPGPSASYPRPTVAIINQSTVMTDAQVQAIVSALQVQVDRDFAPVWYRGAQLVFVAKNGITSPSWWQLVILDDSDMAGALGYHDLTAQGMPLGKVFAKTDLKYGLQSSVTASHELLEMLADPEIDELRGVYNYAGQQAVFACEVCDAVEADALGYQIGGIQVSDFCTRNYYHPGMPGPYSFRGNVSAPLTLAHGGYFSYLPLTSSGWKQQTARFDPAERQDPNMSSAGHPRLNPQPGSRRERRARGREHWKKSTQ